MNLELKYAQANKGIDMSDHPGQRNGKSRKLVHTHGHVEISFFSVLLPDNTNIIKLLSIF